MSHGAPVAMKGAIWNCRTAYPGRASIPLSVGLNAIIG